MTSQSESAETNPTNRAVTGLALVKLVSTDVREVSRLEFYPLDRPKIADDVDLGSEAGGAELLLKEEMAVLDGRLRSQAEEISAQVAMVRSEAKADARREWEVELEQRIAEERAHILKIGEQFRREQSEYFAGVESEVVKLALAIAKRVLHREAQLDPLLLAGVVRVALEKVADESSAVLRVPTKELRVWQEMFVMNPGSSLQVVADERLKSGECVLDTNVGKVELGVSSQLEEIERGFFDLIQQRPV